jgi:type IX secretion system PorP/SprF family membrane protein
MRKLLLLLLLSTIVSWEIQAQQDAQYTHYMFNTLSVNPAYAGSREALTVTGLHRSQWVGFPGAPKTQTLTIHSPFLKDKIGLGLSFINDKIGPTKTTSIYSDFAYKIQVGERGKLSFGLKGGINMRSNDLVALKTIQQGDDSFTTNVASEVLMNFGFGLYYNRKRFYTGLSVPRLLENNFQENQTSEGLAKDNRHLFYIVGGVIDVSKKNKIKIKPTALVKYTRGAPLDVDLTATFLILEKLWIGPMYRLGDAVGGLIGFNITDQLSAGYSFDWSTTNKTSKYNSGSHEVMLRYDLIYKNKRKIRSPRYF